MTPFSGLLNRIIRKKYFVTADWSQSTLTFKDENQSFSGNIFGQLAARQFAKICNSYTPIIEKPKIIVQHHYRTGSNNSDRDYKYFNDVYLIQTYYIFILA